MTITLEVDDVIAARLRKRAATRNSEPEEIASELLGQALEAESNTDWESQNERRLMLIKQSMKRDLTTPEQEELRLLQDEADRRLEQRDHELLSGLGQLERAVEALPDR